MALSDVEIFMELQAGSVVIDPLPDTTTEISASAIDLHLGPRLLVYKQDPGGLSLDLRALNATQLLNFACDEIDLTGEKSHPLSKGEFVIGFTRENITLPAHLCARVEGRSSLARVGLSIHNTAPTIHAGYNNTIALELTNVGPIKLLLSEGIPICQLILESLGRPAANLYRGQFQKT